MLKIWKHSIWISYTLIQTTMNSKMYVGSFVCFHFTQLNSNTNSNSCFFLMFVQVEYILVDPSCSGSGIVNRLDYLIDAFNTSSYCNQNLHSIFFWNITVYVTVFVLLFLVETEDMNSTLLEPNEQSLKDSIMKNSERLRKLSDHQLSLLLHAFKCTFSIFHIPSK
jgi:16S rRNA C967 or C1407 C5-methylase (RsmB/RsmF family)